MCTYSYVLLVLCLYWYVLVCAVMHKLWKVRTSTYIWSVHTGMYWYVPVCTAINQVYRIGFQMSSLSSQSQVLLRTEPSVNYLTFSVPDSTFKLGPRAELGQTISTDNRRGSGAYCSPELSPLGRASRRSETGLRNNRTVARWMLEVCWSVSITMLAIIVILIGYLLHQPCGCVNLWFIMWIISRILLWILPKCQKLQASVLEFQFFFFKWRDISADHCALFLHNMQLIKIVNGFWCAGRWFDGKLPDWFCSHQANYLCVFCWLNRKYHRNLFWFWASTL